MLLKSNLVRQIKDIEKMMIEQGLEVPIPTKRDEPRDESYTTLQRIYLGKMKDLYRGTYVIDEE